MLPDEDKLAEKQEAADTGIDKAADADAGIDTDTDTESKQDSAEAPSLASFFSQLFFGSRTDDQPEASHKRLPTIVFCDEHGDLITSQMLIKLLPKLQALGYVQFCDEASSGKSREEVIKVRQYNIELITAKAKREEASSDGKFGRLHGLYRYIESLELRIKFYNQLAKLGINYQAIDSRYNSLLPYLGYRDKVFAAYHLYNRIIEKPSFEVVGLFHAKGIQEALIRSGLVSEDDHQFLFFYLHGAPIDYSSDDYDDSVKGVDSIPKLKKSYREKKVELPLGMHNFNFASEADEEKYFQEILEIINRQIEALNKASPHEPTPEQKEMQERVREKMEDFPKTEARVFDEFRFEPEKKVAHLDDIFPVTLEERFERECGHKKARFKTLEAFERFKSAWIQLQKEKQESTVEKKPIKKP